MLTQGQHGHPPRPSLSIHPEDDMPERLKSRKFWMALLGAILPILASYLSGELALEPAVQASSAVLCTYVLGQGWVDAAKAKADE